MTLFRVPPRIVGFALALALAGACGGNVVRGEPEPGSGGSGPGVGGTEGTSGSRSTGSGVGITGVGGATGTGPGGTGFGGLGVPGVGAVGGVAGSGAAGSDAGGSGVGGAAECSLLLTPCWDECVDTNQDDQHCGACGVVCPERTRCYFGVCEEFRDERFDWTLLRVTDHERCPDCGLQRDLSPDGRLLVPSFEGGLVEALVSSADMTSIEQLIQNEAFRHGMQEGFECPTQPEGQRIMEVHLGDGRVFAQDILGCPPELEPVQIVDIMDRYL